VLGYRRKWDGSPISRRKKIFAAAAFQVLRWNPATNSVTGSRAMGYALKAAGRPGFGIGAESGRDSLKVLSLYGPSSFWISLDG
jgi:hypothetical protein